MTQPVHCDGLNLATQLLIWAIRQRVYTEHIRPACRLQLEATFRQLGIASVLLDIDLALRAIARGASAHREIRPPGAASLSDDEATIVEVVAALQQDARPVADVRLTSLVSGPLQTAVLHRLIRVAEGLLVAGLFVQLSRVPVRASAPSDMGLASAAIH